MSQLNLKVWLLSARPKTLPAAVAPVLIGASLACAQGALHVPTILITALCALGIQIGANYANDYYDFVKGTDTPDRVGPLRATQAGLVTPRQMRNAFLTTFALTALLALYLVYRGGLPILIIGLASIFCAILYTAGPVPLGYVGLGDIFVLIFFGPVAVGGTCYLQTRAINANVIVAGLAPGLISTAILAVNNFRDIETDRLADKKTLAVRFGYNFGAAEYIFCILAACGVPLYLSLTMQAHYFSNLSLLTLIVAVFPVKTVCSKPSADTLNKVLAQTGQLLLLYSILFSVGWLI